MPKREQKSSNKVQSQSKWASLPWTRVQVTNNDDNANDANLDEAVAKFIKAPNHYDDPRANPKDLFGQGSGGGYDEFSKGADDPGIFLGLEVVDGSQYTVEKIPLGSGDNDRGPNGLNEDGNKSNSGSKGFVTRLIVKDATPLSLQQEHEKETNDSNQVHPQQQRQKQPLPESNTGEDGKKKQKKLSVSRKERNRLKLEKLKAKRKEIQLQKKRKHLAQVDTQGEAPQASSGSTNSTTCPKTQTDEQISNPSEDASNRKKKQKKNKNNQNSKCRKSETLVPVSRRDIESIRVPWSISTGGVYLHHKICQSLFRLGFTSPTPIQSSTLAASILGQRDVVGAAPTGSGKTLSYLLPILHALFTEEDERRQQEADMATPHTDTDHNNDKVIKTLHFDHHPLTALILCPTRELAMQVSMEFAKLVDATETREPTTLCPIKCGTIVGGLSEQKQKRVLNVNRPPVLVATPGRLWDLMSTGEHEHLSYLNKVRFLVIDEADRMISQGSFPQLKLIFEKIQQANPSLEYMEKQARGTAAYEDDSDDEDRMLGLPGIRGEAKLTMIDDELLTMIKKHEKKENKDNSHDSDTDSTDQAPEPMEIDDEEYEAILRRNLDDMDASDDDESDEKECPIKRQTFVFSATLTLPSSLNRSIPASQSKSNGRKGKGRKQVKDVSVDGAISEILEKVGAQGQRKVVDLSTSGGLDSRDRKNKPKDVQYQQKEHPQTANPRFKVQLPPGLSLYEIRCTQKHKDSHLYSFLTTTKQGSAGPCLVFCNSIGAVKRVGETLKVLGLPTKMLHAQMQQKARIASLESLKNSNLRSVVVATDVAARGLDIPSVASIVHYDVARATDTFVHRAGRTARGFGEKAVGWSVSLVAAPEEKNHQSICKAVQGEKTSFDTAPMDGRLLSAAQERTNLACKIVACEDSESRTKKSNQWFIDAANDAGLDLDENLLDDGLSGGSRKERQQFLEAKRARRELKVLLATPMRKQAFGKFLSNAGIREAIRAETEVKPYIVKAGVKSGSSGQTKKKRRKI